MPKFTPEEGGLRVDTMTTLEAVAYANRLSNRLKRDDCTDEERMNAMELLRQVTQRVPFLKITFERAPFCSIGWSYFDKSGNPGE